LDDDSAGVAWYLLGLGVLVCQGKRQSRKKCDTISERTGSNSDALPVGWQVGGRSAEGWPTSCAKHRLTRVGHAIRGPEPAPCPRFAGGIRVQAGARSGDPIPRRRPSAWSALLRPCPVLPGTRQAWIAPQTVAYRQASVAGGSGQT